MDNAEKPAQPLFYAIARALSSPVDLPELDNLKEAVVDTFCNKPVQWNPKADRYMSSFAPQYVRGTSYGEVNVHLGTSGCSRNEPFYDWSVMGVIETPRGKLFVAPTDWIIPLGGDHYLVFSDREYNTLIDPYRIYSAT